MLNEIISKLIDMARQEKSRAAKLMSKDERMKSLVKAQAYIDAAQVARECENIKSGEIK